MASPDARKGDKRGVAVAMDPAPITEVGTSHEATVCADGAGSSRNVAVTTLLATISFRASAFAAHQGRADVWWRRVGVGAAAAQLSLAEGGG